ncbi:MAG TPA: hypothetical protein VK659_10250 [Asanoa sp.]|nr:hypothetical protein [Asanoa sp.]
MFTVLDQIGLRPVSPPSDTGLAAPTQRVAIDDIDAMSWISPRNPLVWIGAILLVTVGAAQVAGSVRLGKAKVSASVGQA